MRAIVTPLYTAKAQAVGGRAGHVRSSDGILDLALTRPKAMGGDGAPGTNPEQLFAAAYSACFESAVRFVSLQSGVKLVACSVSAEVTIGKAEDQGFALAATLTVDMPDVDRGKAMEIVEKAHQMCPFSHATRGNIEVRLQLA
jgi:osmotically inducible protein OsmC